MQKIFRMKYLVLLLSLCSCAAFSQKKIIDHTAYNDWNTKSEVRLSNDGKFTTYVRKPLRGDGFLFIVNNETGKTDSIKRSSGARFTADSKLLIFKITPGFDTLRNCELNKVKKDKWPKDSLGIWYLENDSLVKIAKVKEFIVAEQGTRFAFLSYDNKMPDDKEKHTKKRKKKKKTTEKEASSDGNLLTIYTSDFHERSYAINVTSYKFSKKGDKIAYTAHRKVKADSIKLSMVEFSNLAPDSSFFELYISVPAYNFDDSGNKLVYLSSQDTAKDAKIYQLNLVDLISTKKTMLVTTLEGEYALTKSVNHNLTPYFSKDGSKVFFGVADLPKVAPKDSLLETEKAKLDVWNWKDDRLQPQQLVELSRDEKDTWLSVYDLNTSTFRIIENDSLSLRHNVLNESPYVLGFVEKPYEFAYNWDYPNKTDVYRVNVFTGEAKLLRKAAIYSFSLSPSGKYFTYFNEKDLQSYVYDIDKDEHQCLTCGVKTVWLDDINGQPITPGPVGEVQWLKGEKDLIISSKYDVYKYNFESKKLSSLIDVDAEKNKVRYSITRWNSDSLYVDLNDACVLAFYEKNKDEAFFLSKWDNDHLDLVEKIKTNHQLAGFQRSKNGATIHLQQTNLKDYSDSYIMKSDMSTSIRKISNTNPQQSLYNWATVELISWKSYDKQTLQGLLYKPEDYDSTKSYPLMVYYYELYSDDLHNHYAPKPTASVIHPTEYASSGYLVFIPDIRYEVGHPAKSAYNAIMSGTDYLLKRYKSIDSTRMGLQGQSWGGYQTAQLITMTKRYKAAMAGAPVGNMFSAYGGIRWGSGLNRQFQYERTQSRIGKTIWEAPELYTENSPLFHLPKVQTPLLIMANDMDGAVPWYQGIELFTGLKRLGKPVWMLNYNGDDHNLTKAANKMDLSIRMKQFFDHYLMSKPAPVWMVDGVPALKKGKYYGLDVK